MKKNKYIYLYIILMIVIGIIQLIDWYYGSEDPIWHLIFYIYIIPALSLLFGMLEAKLITPFISLITTFIIYILFANGGLCFDFSGLSLCIFPFITTIIGIAIQKIFKLI